MTSTPLQFQPWTVLGVARDASPGEIRAAFREKSKKYHPDLGGDEWAFLMVRHAYESLRIGPENSDLPGEPSTWNRTEPKRGMDPWVRHPARPTGRDRPEASEPMEKTGIEGSWLTQVWPNAVRWFHPRRNRRSVGPERKASPRRRLPSAEAILSFKTVDVELVWIRFVMESGSESAREKPSQTTGADSSTLSVCLVVSWPPVDAVDSTADYPEATRTMRSIIDVFERLKLDAGPTASRSRIEDGRFVGWLSYIDVIGAESAFERLREGVSAPGLSIRLRTRQERLPFQWRQGANGYAVESDAGEYEPIFSS